MDKTTKTLTLNEALELNDTIDTLFGEHIKYPVNVGYKLYKLRKDLNDLSDYSINCIVELLPELKSENPQLSENDKLIYQTILNSPVEVDIHGLTREELYCYSESSGGAQPTVDLGLIEKMELLF